MQSFTASGMRKHIQTCDGHGIIARDECQRFLKDVLNENKNDSLDATMLVLFHNNRPCFFNSGQEKKGRCIEKTGISFLGYKQPNSFLEVYAKMVDRGDGLIDRSLVSVPHAQVKGYAKRSRSSRDDLSRKSAVGFRDTTESNERSYCCYAVLHRTKKHTV